MKQPPSYFLNVDFTTAITLSAPPLRGYVEDGTRFAWRLRNTGGSSADVTLNGGTVDPGNFKFAIPSTSAFTNPVAVGAGNELYVAAIWNSRQGRWDVVAAVNGY